MVHISKDDIRKSARLAYITIHEDEIEKMVDQLQSVLGYAARVADYAQKASITQKKTVQPCDRTIVRHDIIVNTPTEPLLSAAPEREGNYFVVPVIVESNQ